METFKKIQFKTFSVIRINGLFFISIPKPAVGFIKINNKRYYQCDLTAIKKIIEGGNFPKKAYKKLMHETESPKNLYIEHKLSIAA
jgi:hypothetical protein